MAKETDTPKDEGLQGNETIEEAILETAKGADAGTAGTRADGDPTQNERGRTGDSFRGTAIRRRSDPDRNGKERRRKSLVGRVYEL